MFKLIHHKFTHSRGASEVIGFTLLILISITVSILAISSATSGPIDTIQGQSNTAQAEESFSVMSSATLSSVIEGDNSQTTVNLPFASGDNPVQVSEDSHVSIRVYQSESRTNETVLLDREQMGYIKYNLSGTDESLYMENGALWRVGEDYGETVNKPEFHFEDQTLTFPIAQLNAESQQLSSSAQITHLNSTRNVQQSFVLAKIIEIEIESPTYQAWGSYFEEYSGSDDVIYDHSEESVTVVLGVNQRFVEDITDALYLSGGLVLDGNANIDGDVYTQNFQGNTSNVNGTVTEHSAPDSEFTELEMDSIISSTHSSLKDEGQTVTSSQLQGQRVESGKYYVDGNLAADDITFDLSQGDILLGVKGDLIISGTGSGVNYNVVNPDGGDLEVYLQGDMNMSSGRPEWRVEDDEFSSNVVYGTSTTNIGLAQNSVFEGVIYAPTADSQGSGVSSTGTGNNGGGNNGNGNGNGGGNNGGGNSNVAGCNNVSESLCMGVNSSVEGAVLTGSANVSQNSSITYDEEVIEEFTVDQDNFKRPIVTYIHTSTSEIEVKEGGT